MNSQTFTKLRAFIPLVLLPAFGWAPSTFAQNTAFTYQGRLDDGGVPANGVYDFRFSIYNGSESNATSALSLTEVDAVATSNGLFTAQIPGPAWMFDGSDRWLAVEVRTNATGEFTMLHPWTEITPAPYAVRALTVTSNALDGAYDGAVAFSNPSNTFVGTFTGSGAGLTNLNAWRINGNAGTSPGAQFLGTTDNQPLEIKVNGARAFRLEPNASGPNVIGGFGGNIVGPGYYASVIAGGGISGLNLSNVIFADYSTIGGGVGNAILNDANNSTIGGGVYNTIQNNAPYSTISGGDYITIQTNASYSTIGGGYGNMIQSNASYSTVGGGLEDSIGANSGFATVAGGEYNQVGTNSLHSAIGGGHDNIVAAPNSVIAGGSFNSVTPFSTNAVIGGGAANVIHEARESVIAGGVGNFLDAASAWNTISGGKSNMISFGVGGGTVGGGELNSLGSDCDYAVIAGGFANGIGFVGFGGGLYCSIGGGRGNFINQSTSSTIGGGWSNTVATFASWATIPGGYGNTVGSAYAFAAGRQAKANHAGAFVWGDSQNMDFPSTSSNQFLIRASGGVGIGATNTTGQNGVIAPLVIRGPTGPAPSGFNSADNCLALGNYATSGYKWIQSYGGGLALNPAGNNVGIANTNPTHLLVVGSAVSAAFCDGTTWQNGSDRNAKKDFSEIAPLEILEKVSTLPITQWQYMHEPGGARHLGPMAQDFHAAFGLNGDDDKHISTVDEGGVALAAIQGLNQKLKEKESEIQTLQQRLEKLERLLNQKTGVGR